MTPRRGVDSAAALPQVQVSQHASNPKRRPPQHAVATLGVRRVVKLASACGAVAALLLLVSVTSRGTAHTSQAVCFQPPTVRDEDKAVTGAAGAATALAAPSFLLLWTTAATDFTLRSRRCLESLLFHHPRATVRVFSNSLPPSAIAPLRAAGYAVSVQGYDVAELLRGTPAAPWLLRLAEWEKAPYWYSHLTDVLRLALLWREGGVYVDTDVVLMRPLPWPLPLAMGIESFVRGDPSSPILNGAVLLVPSRRSPLLWVAMHEFASTYHPELWGWNGPELLTRVVLRCAGAFSNAPSGARLTAAGNESLSHGSGAVVGARSSSGASRVLLLPPEVFYPIHWKDVAAYTGAEDLARQERMWRRIERRALAVHLWNRKTAALALHPRSVLYRVLSAFPVLPLEGAVAEGAEAL